MPDAFTSATQDVTGVAANRRDIGFVFQNYALFPHLSVAENVGYGLAVRGQSQGTIAKSVGDVLSLVGLAGYDRQFPGQLSGGEQQRVALARAIVIRPRVLLFDEPLSNLDAKLRVSMRQEIRDLQQRLEITTVYVTHDQEEAMAVSDRIAVMNEGSVVQEGSARDLYHRPASEFVARFVGRVNLVPARVAAVDGDAVIVDALGATLRAQPANRRVARGDLVSLLLAAGVDHRRPRRGCRAVVRNGGGARVSRREDRISRQLRRRHAAGRPLQRRTRRNRRRRHRGVAATRRRCSDTAGGSAAMMRIVALGAASAFALSAGGVRRSRSTA